MTTPQWRIRDLQELCARRVVACISQSQLSQQSSSNIPPAGVRGALGVGKRPIEHHGRTLLAAHQPRELGQRCAQASWGASRRDATVSEVKKRPAAKPPATQSIQRRLARALRARRLARAGALKPPEGRRDASVETGAARQPEAAAKGRRRPDALDARTSRTRPRSAGLKPRRRAFGAGAAAAHARRREEGARHGRCHQVHAAERGTDQGGLEVLSIAGASGKWASRKATHHTALKERHRRTRSGVRRRGGGVCRGLRVYAEAADGHGRASPKAARSRCRHRFVASGARSTAATCSTTTKGYAPREFRPHPLLDRSVRCLHVTTRRRMVWRPYQLARRKARGGHGDVSFEMI